MAKLLLGKAVTEALNAQLLQRSDRLRAAGTVPRLAIIRIGEAQEDLSYERGAVQRAAAVGVQVDAHVLPEQTQLAPLLSLIDRLNADPAVHGVLLFRPLPAHLRQYSHEVCNRLAPEKDVDGMSAVSAAAVFEGSGNAGFPPCTPAACMEILDHYGIDCTGKHAVVIGRSTVVGKPAAMMLLRRNATVTVCHTKTRQLADLCRSADIIVSAAGALHSLRAGHVRPGQILLDVAINWDAAKPNSRGGLGAIAGDAVFFEVEPIVEALTPVPGGVGSVTASVLMKHVIEAAEACAP